MTHSMRTLPVTGCPITMRFIQLPMFSTSVPPVWVIFSLGLLLIFWFFLVAVPADCPSHIPEWPARLESSFWVSLHVFSPITHLTRSFANWTILIWHNWGPSFASLTPLP